MKTILSWFPIGFYSSIEIYRFVTWNQSITFSPIRLAGRQKELGFIIHDSLEEAVVCVCLSLCLSVCLSVYASLFLTLFCRLLAGAWRPRAGPQPQGQPPRLTLTDAVFVLADSARVARRPSPGIWAYGTSSALLYSTWKLYSWWSVWIEMGNIPYYGDFEGQYLGM